MKSSSFFIGGTLIAGILGISVLQEDSNRHLNSVDNISSSVRQRTNRVLSDSPALWGTSPIPFLNNSNTQDSYQNELMRWLNQHESFKTRISHMTWYWEFYGGKISPEEFQKNVRDAYAIEQLLSQNPELLRMIQESNWGQQYLQGEVMPEIILEGNIRNYLQIRQFEQENPEVYGRAVATSAWNLVNTNSSDETLLMDRVTVLEYLKNRSQDLRNNPTILQKIQQFGFSADNIYMDSFQEDEGIYGIIDAISTLENPDNFQQEVWNEFQNSEIGKQYTEGKIDPNRALEYMLNISSKIQESSL